MGAIAKRKSKLRHYAKSKYKGLLRKVIEPDVCYDIQGRPTPEYLKWLFHYNRKTGKLFRRVTRSNQRKRIEVGCPNELGYLTVGVDGKYYLVHRIVWVMSYGYWPEPFIDHIDGDPGNNRLDNLREVSNRCNMQNQRMNSRNTSGFPGVSRYGSRWGAQIRIQGKNLHLGYYSNRLEAALARLTVEVQCEKWTCNHRNEIVKRIEAACPNFFDWDRILA